MNNIKTISVPYIPILNGEVNPPQWFKDNVKSFGDIADIKDYELVEIQGCRLVYFADTDKWEDLGWMAIYRLNTSNKEVK